MKLKDLLGGISIIGGNASLDTDVSDLTMDSRKAAPGRAFVAIPGLKTDGHLYIRQALEAGAPVIICQREIDPRIPHVVLGDTRAAMAVISANFFGHPAGEMTMIGVTGTNGKTTVTHFIKNMLETSRGAKAGLIGTNEILYGGASYGAERTTPEAYELQMLFRAMADAGCTHAVMEVSSHALHQRRVDGFRFDVGVFTNLTQDHLDYHGTIEEYLRAKSLLFKKSERGVINLDDRASDFLLSNAPSDNLTYSARSAEADASASDIELFEGSVEFTLSYGGRAERVSVRVPGMFSVYNALAAAGTGLCLGMSVAEIADALSTAPGIRGRAEVVPLPQGAGFTVIIDYAHTPDGMDNILKTARGFAKGRIITVFGCGGDRDASKRAVMGRIAASLSDYIVVTSDNPRTEDPYAIIEEILSGMRDSKTPFTAVENRREGIRAALSEARRGDTVLVLGKGHETYQEIGGERRRFDDREEVINFFKESTNNA